MKKRYFVIAFFVLLFGLWIFTDKFTQREDKEHAEIEEYDQINDSVFELADKKIEQDSYNKGLDSIAIDSLNNLLDSNTIDQDEIERLRDQIYYHEHRIEMNEEPVLALDSIIMPYSIETRDSIIWNFIMKDSIIWNLITQDSTVVIRDTVYISDTLEVDPEFIKNKFFKD